MSAAENLGPQFKATKTPTDRGFTYEVNGEARNAKADYDFAVAGNGNEYTASGVWFTLHKTRVHASKARDQRGEGSILDFGSEGDSK